MPLGDPQTPTNPNDLAARILAAVGGPTAQPSTTPLPPTGLQPPPPQQAPPPLTPDATNQPNQILPQEILDQMQQGVQTQLGGVQNIQTPAPTRGAPYNPAEEVTAREEAARLLEQRMGQVEQLPGQVADVNALTQAQPGVAAQMGYAPPAVSDFVTDAIKRGYRTGLNMLDIIGSQLGRPHQFVAQTALARAQGDQWQEALEKGLIGSTQYGWHNPHYISFSDVFKAGGMAPGTTYQLPGGLGSFSARDAAGLGADIFLDPLTYATVGADRAARLLPKTGRYLSPLGRGVLMEMERAGVLSENPQIKLWLEYVGRPDLAQGLEKIAPVAKEVLDNPTPAIVARNKQAIKKLLDPILEEVEKAKAAGNLQIPSPNTTTGFEPFHAMDSALAAQMSDRLADWMLANPKLAQGMEDMGGLKVAGRTVLPGRPLREGVGRLIAAGAESTAGGMEQLGQAMQDIKMPGPIRAAGSWIERKPYQAKRLGETLGRVFDNYYGLEPRFARDLQHDYYGRFSGVEYELRQRIDQIFKGSSYADRTALTNAIDQRALPELLTKRPDLKPLADGLYQAQEELWQEMLARRLVSPDQKLDNYIFHFYKNPRKTASILSQRGLIPSPRTLDPSTYQRRFPSLAAARLAGLDPEYDSAKLLAMRMTNGWRAIVAHDFLQQTVERYRLTPIREIPQRDLVTLTAAMAEGESFKELEPIADQIRQGLVDVSDPTRSREIAERLALEGGTSANLDILDTLPDPTKREFFRLRFDRAIKNPDPRGMGRELANIRKRYSAYQDYWPQGTGDVLADTYQLPPLLPKDRGYRTIQIPKIGTVVMPSRIVDKLAELQHTSIFDKAGGPTRELLSLYDRTFLNPWRKFTTILWPSFNVRNAYTNVINSGMDIGLAVLNPRTRAEAQGILQGRRFRIATPSGTLHSTDLMAEFVRQGGMNTVYRRGQVASPAVAQALAQDVSGDLSAWRAINPFFYTRILGDTIENDARMVHFLALRKDGIPAPQAMERVHKFLFDYQNGLSPTERQVFRRLIPFYCVPDTTEILTAQGWKTCDQLKVGETVLTYNIDKDELEWQPCLDKAIFPHDQDLNVIRSARREVRFTPEHRWVVETVPAIANHPYGHYEYGWRNRRLVKGSEITPSQAIIMTARFKGTNSLLTPDQARLLGWLLTDGYWRWRGGHCEAMIYQHPRKFLAEVIEIAGGNPRAPHPDTGTVCVPVLKERIEPLKPYLYRSKRDGHWIDVLSQLSQEALEAMYDAMYKADGTVSSKRKGDFIARASDPGIRDTIAALGTLLGKRTRASKTGFYLSNQRRWKMNMPERTSEHYTGRVWCPTTSNGTWIMRQGSTITISGNSWIRFNTPLQVEMIARKPRILLTYDKVFNRLGSEKSPERRYVEQDLLPQYLKTEWALPAGQGMAPQNVKYLMGVDLPQSDLNFLYKHDLGTTVDNLAGQLGPAFPLGEALMAMMGARDTDLQKGIDQGSPTYAVLDLLDKHPATKPLAKWLGVRRALDRNGRAIVVADPTRTRTLATLAFMDRPLREISRFVGPEDSPTAALARWLTGGRFIEFDPAESRRRELDHAYSRAASYLTRAKGDLTNALVKAGVMPTTNPLETPRP